MDHTVYFADKTVVFTAEPPSGEWFRIEPDADGGISRAKVVNFLETYNKIAVTAADPDAAFARFAADFTAVEAAGGAAVGPDGRCLMMRRNGRWDLPKGHVEEGERIEVCAVRETEEETGIRTEAVVRLCRTLHAYWFAKTARWELKRTHWFLLRASECGEPTPQTEEGIECVRWCSPDEAARLAADAFPTVRKVLEELRKQGA